MTEIEQVAIQFETTLRFCVRINKTWHFGGNLGS